MTQTQSIRMSQPWALLHEPADPKARVDQQSEAERAAAAKKIEAAVARHRDHVLTDFTLCSRPYF